MMPVSRRRLNAETRTVLTISMSATTSMSAITARAAQFMPLRSSKRLSRVARWSATDCTPSRPSKAVAMTWYFSGSFSLIQCDSCIWSGVSELASGESPNWSL